MRGRRNKPTKIKEIEGNPGGRKLNKLEPKPPLASLEPPEGLEGYALATWARTAPLLSNLRVFTEADRDALESYCVAYGTFKKACEIMRDNEAKMASSRKALILYKSAHSVMRHSQDMMRKLAVEFGMTPSSRTRIPTGSGTGDESEDDKFFGASPGALKVEKNKGKKEQTRPTIH